MDNVFRLLPRRCVVDRPSVSPGDVLSALYDLESCTAVSGRGNDRIVLLEESSCRYSNVGMKPNRSSVGVSLFFPKKLAPISLRTINKVMRNVEETAIQYVESQLLRAYMNTKKEGQWDGASKNQIWTAMASSRNCVLSSHTDHDFFLGVVFVHSKPVAATYELSDSVIAYFVFPTVGVAVALRPGDMLIFNPQVYHSISTRNRFDVDVFACSTYLKTANVGLNDNSLI
jgi:hypothetical protein